MAQVSSLRTGIKFKDTPIGKLPVDWDLKPVSEIALVVMGQSPPSADCSGSEDGLPFYQGNAEFGAIYPTPTKWCANPLKIAQKGDILISVRAPVGEMNIAPHECCIGRGLAAIRATIIEHGYLLQSLLSRRHELKKISQGSTFDAINSKDLAGFLLPVPPPPEQRKIAEVLTTVDEAIEETDRIIEKTKELKKGLMQRLLTRGIRRTETQEERRGIISKGWDVVRLGEICQVIGGSTPSTSERIYWNGDIPWATPTDITGLKGRLIADTGQHISDEGLSSCAAILLPEGSILMTSRATIGACAINTRPMATNQGFSSLVCGRKVYNWFMYYQMLFLRGELERLAGGSTFKEIPKRSVRSIRILLPPLSEQRRIADLLNSTDDEIESRETTKEQLHTVKKSLMQVLLTGRVRVKVA